MDPADQYQTPYGFVNNNPIRFYDPDGNLGDDFHDSGEERESKVRLEEYKAPSGIEGTLIVEWKSKYGYVLADDGETKIEAFKQITDPTFKLVDEKGNILLEGRDACVAKDRVVNVAQNCIAAAFSQGKLQLWINPDQVPNIYKGDGYKFVDSPKKMDIVLWSVKNGTNQNILKSVGHAAIVTILNPNYYNTAASKEGIWEFKGVLTIGFPDSDIGENLNYIRKVNKK